nr:exportin-7 [Quercus suber]
MYTINLATMSSPSDSWMRGINEASKLAEDIKDMIAGSSSLPPSGPETQRHLSTARRKITILRTKLETLELLLSTLSNTQPITGKEMNRRQDMLKNLSSKANQMAATLNMSGFNNRDSLLGPNIKQDDIMNRTKCLDNHGLVGFQRQIIKEQDEGLEKLEETVTSTKHIALAVNEELNLHTRLLDNLDQHVDSTDSHLQRVQKKLAALNRRTKGGCSYLILLVIAAVILIIVVWALVKHLAHVFAFYPRLMLPFCFGPSISYVYWLYVGKARELTSLLDSVERAHAERTLKCFSVNTDYISQCQYILDNSLTPYALMLASSSLLKQVTEQSLPLQLRLDIRNYLINYLATRGPDLEPFVVGSLIQLLCRVTKFGWLDDDRFKEVIKEAMNFLSQAPYHCAIGLKILNQLVSEMNQTNSGLPSMLQRKIAISFKDQSLFQVFQISLTSLHQLKNDVGSKLQELVLSLSLNVLSFDFMGTSFDESSDEIGMVQIPISWRPVIQDPSTLQIFFDYYAITQSHFSKEALECLLRLACIRRSFFINDATRLKFLSHLMTGTKEILQSGIGLADHDNYHTFCRLLGRFKVNYQLSELVNADGYTDWIRLVADFTLKSLHSWQWAGSSVYYLLGMWSRLVTSVRFLKTDTANLLDEYAPKIIEGFISSRFDSLQSEFSDELYEDPLDNVELLQDQLDFIPYLCRFQYETCGMYIMKIMEPILQLYMGGANLQCCADNIQLSLAEVKLAWIVHIVAAILKTKQISGFSGELQEVFDAELSARVWQLINVTDSGLHSQRYGELSKQRLDCAILTFLQQFRKSFVGDYALHSSKQLYARLSELLGIHDHLLLLVAIVRKIVTNLKSYSQSKAVIDHTLSVFLEMTSGSMLGKLLLKLDIIKSIIAHHDKEHFPFLDDYRCSRSRTTFYFAIATLIFMEDSLLKFKSSMDPLLQVFVSLESTSDATFHSDAVKYALIGLMRDLRGIAMATKSHRTYCFLFDWLYPARLPLLLKAIAYWTDTPEVTTPLLKFIAELVLNKSERLAFDSSSPNGILLFQEVSKLTVAYGSRILPLRNAADMYTFKYKGIWICLTILTRALAGNYVNFGVFELYGDRSLADALDVALRMILSIPLADVLKFRKLAQAYFAFLEILFNSHMAFILNLDTSTFMYIVGSLEAGLKGLIENISTQCASAVDKLATFYFLDIVTGESPSSPAALCLAQHITNCPGLFQEILSTLFEIIIFGDGGNQRNLSRPMLSLILINEETLTNIKGQILASHPPDQQQQLSLCFEKLMADITRSLDLNNRDKFTQNLIRFKNEFRSKRYAAILT